jgi:hypothetical protein
LGALVLQTDVLRCRRLIAIVFFLEFYYRGVGYETILISTRRSASKKRKKRRCEARRLLSWSK